MSWFDEGHIKRWPIAVDKLSAGVAAVDVTITVPSDFETFWGSLSDQVNGDDLRITDADGVTLEIYQLASFDFPTRTAVIEVQSAVPPVEDCIFQLWMYFENSGAANAETAFTASSPRTGTILTACPSGTILRAAPEQPGAIRPRRQFSKTSLETILPWWDVSQLLEQRCTKFNAAVFQEEISFVQQEVLSDDLNQPTEFDETLIRFGGDRQGFIRFHVTAGIDGEDRTVRLSVGTTEGRVLDPRAWLKIRDTDEQ